jgi:tripartite-type tricarboxylate transporter receptor subunit TctC
VLGPKALPRDVVARWNSEVNRILQMNDVKERLASDGMVAAGGPPERVAEVLKRDVAKWQRVVKTAGIKTEG